MKKGIWVQVRNFYYKSEDYDVGAEELAKKFKEKGVTHVYTGFTVPETEPLIERFVKACNEQEIDVYIGLNVTDYELMTDLIHRLQYILDRNWDIKGIVLDYVRFKYFNILNIFKTGVVTDQIKMVREFLPPRYKLHAALKSGWYFSKFFNNLYAKCWGVDYKSISKYLSALCPMMYTGLYQIASESIYGPIKWLNEWSNGRCEPILQVYYDTEEKEDMIEPTPERVSDEVKITQDAGSTSHSLFRYSRKWGWCLNA